jgi:hypothetical protein
MNTNAIARTLCIVTATATLCGVGGAAQARTDAGPLLPVFKVMDRPLERVGTQFVRGDDLTGNGVEAPLWIPDQ